MIAQVPDFAALLAPYGIAGIMLTWFMWRDQRIERRLLGNENATNRQTRAISGLIVALAHTHAAKDEARKIVEEIDSSERSRRDGRDEENGK